MRTKTVLAVLLAAVAAAVVVELPAVPARADTGGPGDGLVIDVISATGTGCPPGTVSVAVSPDDGFALRYAAMTAMVGVGAARTDFRKACQITLLGHVPDGYTYGVRQADQWGYASLAAGATGTVRTTYSFQGTPSAVPISHAFMGPVEDAWQVTDLWDYAQVVYAPCGAVRYLNINISLQVGAGSSDPTTTTSFLTMDTADSSSGSTFQFTVKACS